MGLARCEHQGSLGKVVQQRALGSRRLLEADDRSIETFHAGLRALGPAREHQRSAATAAVHHPRHGHAQVLDGRAVAAAWQEELARDVRDVLTKSGRPPGLGVVLVGSRPDSLLYVSRKREACERVSLGAGGA